VNPYTTTRRIDVIPGLAAWNDAIQRSMDEYAAHPFYDRRFGHNQYHRKSRVLIGCPVTVYRTYLGRDGRFYDMGSYCNEGDGGLCAKHAADKVRLGGAPDAA
jgi:hypothetical protein